MHWCYRQKGGIPLLVYSLVHSSFNQGFQVRFPAGSQRLVNLFGAGMPRDYLLVKLRGEGDVWSVTVTFLVIAKPIKKCSSIHLKCEIPTNVTLVQNFRIRSEIILNSSDIHPIVGLASLI